MLMLSKCPCCHSSTLKMSGSIIGCSDCSYTSHASDIDDITEEDDLELDSLEDRDILDLDEC
jgi:hypothetical protein